jgi:HAD superfamily hydrolase (TIGR01549 family)
MKESPAFVFDLDGTLVDSFDQISECCTKIRNRLKLRTVEKDELEKLIGLPADQLFFDCPPQIMDRAVDMFREELLKEIEVNNKLFLGASELLIILKQKGIGTAVATSKPHHLAKKVVKNSSLNGLIDYIQGVDGFPPKPNPEVILRCQAHFLARKFVMVGDRPEDIQAGLDSGCFTVGIAQGTFGEEELRSIGAHEVFQSIEHLTYEIAEFLTRLESYG